MGNLRDDGAAQSGEEVNDVILKYGYMIQVYV